MITITCSKCGCRKTITSKCGCRKTITCPKCGNPITPDEIEPIIGTVVDPAKESGCICELCRNPVDPTQCKDGYTPYCNELIIWPV